MVQSLEELEARDREGTLESWVEERWTCPSTVEAAIAQQRKEGDVLVVVPDSTANSGERPWGVSVPDAAQEARVLAMMKAIAKNKASADVLSTLFTIGPALYKSLLGADKELGRDTVTTIGTTTMAVVPVGKRLVKMPMRTYLEQEHRVALLQASPFRGIALALSEGKSRAATEAERQLLYALVAFEIADAPVTVIEMQGHVAVAYFDGDKLMWLDILSDY